MPWYANGRVYAGLLDGSETARVELADNRYAYVHVIRGAVTVNGTQLGDGDGARVRGERRPSFSDGRDAELPVFDLPPKETPGARASFIRT